MKTPVLLFVCFAFAAPLAAQAGTDIWLADIGERGGELVLSNVRRVTDRPGYDNQPQFTASGTAILYTSYRNGQADIWRYNIARGTHTQVTRTPESEYSATERPDGQGRLAVVRVESDSTQRLWTFAPDGSDFQVLAPELRGVGYYAWMPDNNLVAYIVGDTSRLFLVDLENGGQNQITENIGRTLQVISDDPSVMFIVRDGDRSQLAAWSPLAPGPLSLGELPGGPYFAFDTSHDLLFAPQGDQIMVMAAANAGAGFSPVRGLEGLGLTGITRMTVSADGARIAFVAAEPE